MVVEVRRAEPSDAKAIKGIYECPNAYTGTLQLPLPSSDMLRISVIAIARFGLFRSPDPAVFLSSYFYSK
ncbi:hypothetical protein VCSRO162_3385 [Vibrio cholerae]|nr:hypothetical protein VCSRO162_3385 [Vibrio cholerae]